MSEANAKVNTEAQSDESAVAELTARYEKKDKVVALVNDDQEAFALFVDTIGEANYQNWLAGTDNKVFTGLAMVRSEGQANRLIPIANEDAVFADLAVRKALYRIYVNRVVNSASDNDASAAQYLTVGGCFKQKFDLDAFKFQAKVLCKILRKNNVNGVTTSALRLSFASAAFAKTQFPRVPDDAWGKVIAIAKQTAEKHGYDVSIFDHWLATRAVQTADTSMIELDLSELQAAEDDLGNDDAGEAGKENPVAV